MPCGRRSLPSQGRAPLADRTLIEVEACVREASCGPDPVALSSLAGHLLWVQGRQGLPGLCADIGCTLPQPWSRPCSAAVTTAGAEGSLHRQSKLRTDRSITPTRLSFVTAAAAAAAAAAAPTTTTAATAAATPKPGVLEYTTWGPVAEEDTERALKRMAMLARDEHQKDPSFSVEEYYSMRLAKLIEEAEISFDATHLH